MAHNMMCCYQVEWNRTILTMQEMGCLPTDISVPELQTSGPVGTLLWIGLDQVNYEKYRGTLFFFFFLFFFPFLQYVPISSASIPAYNVCIGPTRGE